MGIKKSDLIEEIFKDLTTYENINDLKDLRFVIRRIIDLSVNKYDMLPPRHKHYSEDLDRYPRGYEWESEDND